MKNILILFLIVLFASKCRYKNNDNLSFQLVKTRLQKTWVLQEGISNGLDVTFYNLNEEMSIINVSKTKIYIKGPGREVYNEYGFKNKKTTIFLTFQNQDYELRITKLTNKELWLEGNSIIGVLGSPKKETIIKVKYLAK